MEGRFSGQPAEKWDVSFSLASKHLFLVWFPESHIKANLRDLKIVRWFSAVPSLAVAFRGFASQFSFRRACEPLIRDDVTLVFAKCAIVPFRFQRVSCTEANIHARNVHEHTEHTISSDRPARLRRDGPPEAASRTSKEQLLIDSKFCKGTASWSFCMRVWEAKNLRIPSIRLSRSSLPLLLWYNIFFRCEPTNTSRMFCVHGMLWI